MSHNIYFINMLCVFIRSASLSICFYGEIKKTTDSFLSKKAIYLEQ